VVWEDARAQSRASDPINPVGRFVDVHWFPDLFDEAALNPDHVRYIALSPLAKDMAVNMFGAL
jgi:hypothetical protein